MEIIFGLLGLVVGAIIGVVFVTKVVITRWYCGSLELSDPMHLRIFDSKPLAKESEYIILKVDYGKDRE